MINRQNRSIVFSNNYKPSINSYYTKGRFEPSKKDIEKLEHELPKKFLSLQKVCIQDYLKQQHNLNDKQKAIVKRRLIKVIRRESKRIKKYAKFYYGYTSNDDQKLIFIRLIDFESIDKDEFQKLTVKEITNILFKGHEWNRYYGIVHESLIYDIKKSELFGNISSRPFRFAEEKC